MPTRAFWSSCDHILANPPKGIGVGAGMAEVGRDEVGWDGMGCGGAGCVKIETGRGKGE